MAFMMPVVKKDWDIYNTNKRKENERVGNGRVRKVSESRSEGPATMSPRSSATLSPHRSAPTMRSLSYNRPPPSRVSLRAPVDNHSPKGTGSPTKASADKFHSRLVEKLKKALGRSDSRASERTS